MFFRIACSLLVLAHLSNGFVQFANSTMYDITDFQGGYEVTLTRCDEGCLIYASITDEGKDYMENLAIYDKMGSFAQRVTSIASIAKMVDDTSMKQSLNLGRSGTYTIRNLNRADATPYDVAVYVVDRLTAYSRNYEIYDAATMARANVVPKSIVTVMAAKQFVVKADKGAPNSFAAYLTGPDNAQEHNHDACTYAYQRPTFEGFEFHVNGPIISIVFNMKNLVAISANYDWSNVRDLSMAGFISSPGYHGCASVDPMQVYRQLNQGYTGEDFDLKSDNKNNVLFDSHTNVTTDIVFNDMTNSRKSTVSGLQNSFQVTMENTQFAIVSYRDVSPPYGFITRHTATKV